MLKGNLSYTYKWEQYMHNGSSDEVYTADNIYEQFTRKQVTVINRYFKMRSRDIFARELPTASMGRIHKGISEKKLNKLKQLKAGTQDADWTYTGCIDTGHVGGGVCEFNHPLRYVHYAMCEDVELMFGSTCVKDFFDVDDRVIKLLVKAATQTMEEIRRVSYLVFRDVNYGESAAADYMKANYPFISSLVKQNDAGLVARLGGYYPIMVEFLRLEIPLPKALVRPIQDYYNSVVYNRNTVETLYEVLANGYADERITEMPNLEQVTQDIVAKAEERESINPLYKGRLRLPHEVLRLVPQVLQLLGNLDDCEDYTALQNLAYMAMLCYQYNRLPLGMAERLHNAHVPQHVQHLMSRVPDEPVTLADVVGLTHTPIIGLRPCDVSGTPLTPCEEFFASTMQGPESFNDSLNTIFFGGTRNVTSASSVAVLAATLTSDRWLELYDYFEGFVTNEIKAVEDEKMHRWYKSNQRIVTKGLSSYKSSNFLPKNQNVFWIAKEMLEHPDELAQVEPQAEQMLGICRQIQSITADTVLYAANKLDQHKDNEESLKEYVIAVYDKMLAVRRANFQEDFVELAAPSSTLYDERNRLVTLVVSVRTPKYGVLTYAVHMAGNGEIYDIEDFNSGSRHVVENKEIDKFAIENRANGEALGHQLCLFGDYCIKDLGQFGYTAADKDAALQLYAWMVEQKGYTKVPNVQRILRDFGFNAPDIKAEAKKYSTGDYTSTVTLVMLLVYLYRLMYKEKIAEMHEDLAVAGAFDRSGKRIN